MSERPNHGVALMCPGQGAYYVGMGRAAYERSPGARALFARANEALGYELSRLCFEGPDDTLRSTEAQQPALLVCALALRAATEDDRPTACVAGHSLGLYTALVVAGALQDTDAVRLVARRGALMHDAGRRRPGGMAALLGLDDESVIELCHAATRGDDVVVAANFNCPGQVVISGTCLALERAIEAATARGARKVVMLPVSGAFHSPLMSRAADELRADLGAVDIAEPLCPVVANTTGHFLRTAAEIRSELAEQIAAPVRWSDGVRRMIDAGIGTLIDCGPGTTLATLARKIVPDTVAIERLDG